MRNNITKTLGAGLALLVFTAVPGLAGGSLETFDITGFVPSPIPGHLVAKVVPIRWDSRCIPVQYSMNDIDPIPNPLGAPVLSLADAEAELQGSMDEWNDIRTSFIEMNIVNRTTNAGTRGFDLVNEQTFNTPAGAGFIASSPSTSLIQDALFVDGDDIDGDGDSDVSNTISQCADVDGDGDIEFPEGEYKAGTILDNDVQYNASVFRFTVADADIDAIGNSVDLKAVAVHELGHSHGLSHVTGNQLSSRDGTGVSMFPLIDTGDPDAELSQRDLSDDDIAISSFLYPEGTASSGPAALKFGDLPFKFFFGTIEGDVFAGNQGGLPVAGAAVSAIRPGLDRQASAAFSGTTQLSFDPVSGGLFLVSQAFNILDGRYTIPVRFGAFNVGIEALDGAPVAAGQVNFTTQIGAIFGQQGFTEEFFNGRDEAAIEEDPGDRDFVVAIPSRAKTGIDITTNVVTVQADFAGIQSVGFTDAVEGDSYAVLFPAAEVAAADTGSGLAIQAGLFRTFVLDASAVPSFAEAALTTCSLNEDGTADINLRRPLRRDRFFTGQDNDLAPFFFRRPGRLGRDVLEDIADGKIEALCLVLEVGREPFAGPSGLPPLVGLETVAASGTSFFSTDGGATFNPIPFNLNFGLQLSDLP